MMTVITMLEVTMMVMMNMMKKMVMTMMVIMMITKVVLGSGDKNKDNHDQHVVTCNNDSTQNNQYKIIVVGSILQTL